MATVKPDAAAIAARAPKTWFGQPPGLTVLFMTETWEKFSYYGMRAILVYYMTKALHFSPAKASLIYGLYTSLAYFTPIFGGALSDRWLSRRTAIVMGGGLMALGHFMLAFEPLFYPGLLAIAVGNGFYLPNLPSQIGDLYPLGDPRRGSAYNVYYVGINLGSFFAPLICGTLGEFYGWHLGFGAAGVGMCLGLLTYLTGARLLPPEPARSATVRPRVQRAPEGPRTFWLLLGVGVAVVLFRGAYEQVANTIALWGDGEVDRRLGGFMIPATWFQSLNPLLIFTLTPFLVAAWSRAARRGREPSPLQKMTLGALGLAAAYGILVGVTIVTARTGAQAHWLWLAAFIVVMTLAELHILPIGLGLFARLAPIHLAATTIAAWFFASFAGNLLAGVVGTAWGGASHAAFFAMMSGLAVLSALVLWRLDRPARAVEAAHAASPPRD